MDRKEPACELGALSVFRGVLHTAPMQALLRFLCCDDRTECVSLFGEFVSSLAEDRFDFSAFLCRAVYTDENSYVKAAAHGEVPSPELRDNAMAELAIFSRLSTLDARTLCADLGYKGYLPQFAVTPVDFEKTYAERLRHIDRYGYGVFAAARMFRVAGEDILPVSASDGISPDDFVGYETERARVFDNTRALIEGKPAANILLFGDAGTGKSSTVKACANHFADEGVRLIELRKDQLFALPQVMGRIRENPLKFIIFIDDLSFSQNDDCFSMLKAALEGSAAAKAKNAVIYATSNRRHLVKETFSARGDDIHHNDTVGELLSLSDRFGLTVYFEKPGKALYLDIVHQLAARRGITLDTAELDRRAEAYALGKGSRSPRAAEQFVNSLV